MARPEPHREEETKAQPRKHPRDLHEDDRRDAMSALARKRWEKRDRMRAAANDDALHDANIDASGAEGGATQSGMAASSTGSSATETVDQAIVRALERKAESGDIAAAKELREWRRCDTTKGADADTLRLASIISRMSRAERDRLRRWLVQLGAAADAEANEHPAPRRTPTL